MTHGVGLRRSVWKDLGILSQNVWLVYKGSVVDSGLQLVWIGCFVWLCGFGYSGWKDTFPLWFTIAVDEIALVGDPSVNFGVWFSWILLFLESVMFGRLKLLKVSRKLYIILELAVSVGAPECSCCKHLRCALFVGLCWIKIILLLHGSSSSMRSDWCGQQGGSC